MNNAYALTQEDDVPDIAPQLRERATYLAELVEALTNIAGSSYWAVLRQNVFDVDLSNARSRLAKEKDTTEIFRLQGEIRWAEKFDLEKLIVIYRNELLEIRKKLL